MAEAGERGCLGEAWRGQGRRTAMKYSGRPEVSGLEALLLCVRGAQACGPPSVAELRSLPRREEEAQCEAEDPAVSSSWEAGAG